METFLGQMLLGAQMWRGGDSRRGEGAGAPAEGGKEHQEPTSSLSGPTGERVAQCQQASWGYGVMLVPWNGALVWNDPMQCGLIAKTMETCSKVELEATVQEMVEAKATPVSLNSSQAVCL